MQYGYFDDQNKEYDAMSKKNVTVRAQKTVNNCDWLHGYTSFAPLAGQILDPIISYHTQAMSSDDLVSRHLSFWVIFVVVI